MTTEQPQPPRVFISYSWSTEEHTAWVADLGERLMSDGIDVVLDQWSLKDGHDLNHFMEQMVADPSIKRVVIISDAQYAAKADARKGGVGTESQIISPEIYKSVNQEKFIPVLRERNADGSPCLPVYLKGRKYIDFSDPDSEAAAYEALLRNIYERPVRRKPALGKAPSELFEDETVVIPAAQKARRFREIVASGKGNLAAAFDDFAEEFLTNVEPLRLVYSHDKKDTWCNEVFENIERTRVYRDLFVDVIQYAVRNVRDVWLIERIESFLERLLPFQFRPHKLTAYFECSEDNYRFLLYELFLYTVASLIKAKRFDETRALLDHRYVALQTLDGETLKGFAFSQFNNRADSLEGECAKRGNTRRTSVMADLVHDRANRSDVRFSDLLQADVLCCLACTLTADDQWLARSLVYAGSVGSLELFLRATNESGFQPIKTLLRLQTPQELIQHISSEKVVRIMNAHDQWGRTPIDELFNFAELEKRWPKARRS